MSASVCLSWRLSESGASTRPERCESLGAEVLDEVAGRVVTAVSRGDEWTVPADPVGLQAVSPPRGRELAMTNVARS
jgi:hypothetical protein